MKLKDFIHFILTDKLFVYSVSSFLLSIALFSINGYLEDIIEKPYTTNLKFTVVGFLKGLLFIIFSIKT